MRVGFSSSQHRETFVGAASFHGHARVFETALAVIFNIRVCADDEVTIALLSVLNVYVRIFLVVATGNTTALSHVQKCPHETARPASFILSQSSSRDSPLRLAGSCPKIKWER